jgi:hypothetical protein
MGSQRHHRPVANNITKKAKKGQGTKPCPPYFLPHYLTNEFLFFQLRRCRAVHTIWDISVPRMNGKPATPSPCCQQHYQEGGKRARYETMPSKFSTPLSNKRIFIFSITLLHSGQETWGYLRPQNEWEAGNTIALSPTTLQRRRKKGVVRIHSLHIFCLIISQTNFYFFNYIVAGWSTQLGISPPPE